MKVGVIGVQGAVSEHIEATKRLWKGLTLAEKSFGLKEQIN